MDDRRKLQWRNSTSRAALQSSGLYHCFQSRISVGDPSHFVIPTTIRAQRPRYVTFSAIFVTYLGRLQLTLKVLSADSLKSPRSDLLPTTVSVSIAQCKHPSFQHVSPPIRQTKIPTSNGEQSAPHSVLIQQSTDFTILLPPRLYSG